MKLLFLFLLIRFPRLCHLKCSGGAELNACGLSTAPITDEQSLRVIPPPYGIVRAGLNTGPTSLT